MTTKTAEKPKTGVERRNQVRGVYRGLLERDKREMADLVSKVARILEPELKLTPANAADEKTGKSVDNSLDMTGEPTDDELLAHFDEIVGD